MTVDIATLAIRIDSLEARNAARELDRMGDASGKAEKSTKGLEDATRKLQGALAILGIGAGVAAIIEMSDAYAKYTAQLRLATQSQNEYNKAYADVKRIATESQQALGATGMLYARIANGTRELGIEQKRVAAITESVNLALKVSGATAAESASAQLQLSQAFAAGTLRGEEFNAVNEAAPRLMLALADGIGVPVGALKKMAEEGQITSKIMADVLPKALESLREEAKQVQTIGGAFTVLKSNLMEFIGIQSQANGSVALITGAIGLLAQNLGALAVVMATIAAAKMGNAIYDWTTKTYGQIAASAELRAATIATAQAELARAEATIASTTAGRLALGVTQNDVTAKLIQANATIAQSTAAIAAAEAAGAQSFALRTLRIATADLAVAETMRAALLTESMALDKAKVAASAQLTAALAAQTAAQTALAGATASAGVAAGIFSRAIGFLGGPVGAIITLLGIGAMAWSTWGDSGSKAEKKVVDTLADEIDGYLVNLNKQIAKLKERNELAGKKMITGAEPATDGEKKREAIMAEINRISQDTSIGIVARTEQLRVWGGRLNQVTVDIERFAEAQSKANALTRDARLKVWFGENGTAAQRLEAELEKLRKQFGTLTPEMEKLTRAKFMDKGANKEIKEQAKLIAELAGLTSTFAEDWARLNGMYKAGTLNVEQLTKAQAELLSNQPAIKAAHDEQEAALKQINAFNKLYAEGLALTTDWQKKAIKEATTEAEKNEELARTFGMTKGAIEALELARLQEQLAQRTSTGLTIDEIATLEKLIEMKKRSAAATSTTDRLELERKANEASVKEYTETVDKYNDIFRKGFASMLNKGEGGWRAFTKSLVTTFKTTVADQIYKMLAQPFVVKLIGSLLGVTGSGLASAAQSVGGANSALQMTTLSSSLLNIGSSLNSAYVSSGMAYGTNFGSQQSMLLAQQEAGMGFNASTGMAGTIASGVAGGLAAYGIGEKYGAGAGMVAGVGSVAAGGAIAGGMAGTGMAAGAMSALAAIPVWGWAAIAGMAILGGMQDGPEKNTRLGFTTNNAPGAISINERGNEGKTGQSYIDGSSTGAFGSFGVSSSFWMNAGQPVVQDFIKSVTATDDALAQFMTTTERASVQAALTGKTLTANMGAEGTNPNADGALDRIFAERIRSILDGVDAGMSSLLDGFSGTSQQLATETAALLQYRAALKDSGEAVFGMAVTLQEIAALKGPTEATSAALARVTAAFNVTNQVAQLLGKDTATAFGAVGLASTAAREQLIQMAGGAEALAQKTATFAQTYFSEAERLVPITKAVDDAMAALGLSSVKTMDQFKQTVLAIDLSSETGAKLYADMMNVAGAFAQVHPAIVSVTDAVEDLGDAARVTADIAKERADIDKKIFDLTHTAAEILLDDRQRELAALDVSNRPRQEYLNSLIDQADALERVADAERAFSDQRRDLQSQYDALTMTPAQLLAKQRAGILEGNRALFDSVAALNAEKEARAAYSSVLDVQKTSLQGVISAMSAWGTSLRGLKDSLLLGNLSPLSPEKKYAAARAQYDQTLSSALGGDVAAQGRYQSALTAFLTASQVANASDAQYQSDFARTQADLGYAIDWATMNVDVAQASLDALNKQITGLTTINSSVLAVSEAVRQLGTVAGAGQSTLVTPSTPTLNYAGMGTLSMAPLVEEVKALRASNESLVKEVQGLRADAERQTGAKIAGGFAASDAAANKIVSGTAEAASKTAWGGQHKEVVN